LRSQAPEKKGGIYGRGERSSPMYSRQQHKKRAKKKEN